MRPSRLLIPWGRVKEAESVVKEAAEKARVPYRRAQKVAAVVACTIKLGLRKVVCLNPQSFRLQSQPSSRECRRHFRRRVWISIQRYGEISTTLLMVIR